MDLLGHVNNVTYVDYLQEARVDMLRVHPPAAGGEDLAEGVVVARHEVRYLHPLVFRREPVCIEVWVTEIRAATFTLCYEVFEDGPEGRTVYLQARSVLTPYVFTAEHPRLLRPEEKQVLERFLEPDPSPLRPQVPVGAPDQGEPYQCFVRFSDIDAYRHVNNVKYFEYYQEARIDLLSRLGDLSMEQWHVVVAQVDVDYRAPVLFREAPYDVDCWVDTVGRSSFVVHAQIRDDGSVLSRSRAVMVAFDPETQRAAPLSDRQRSILAGQPVAAGPDGPDGPTRR
jgi:acyl-CoA thioester hydrolase